MAKGAGIRESIKVFLDVAPDERLITLLLFAWQFLFICTYYVLRPIRRGLFLDGLGNDWMPVVYVGTAVVTGLVVWLYSKFAHLKRRTLICSIYGFFAVNLLIWWRVFQKDNPIASGIFWVWLDVFSIMGVTLFWIYANDVFNSARAKRLFGILAAGGGLGAVFGASITAGFVHLIGTGNLFLVAAGLIVTTLAIFLYLEKLSSKNAMGSDKKSSSEIKTQDLKNLSGVFKTIASNKLLLLLTILVTFERVTPDMVQFLYNDVIKNLAHGGGCEAIVALDANLERWRAIAEFFVEMFLVSAVLKKFGTGFALSSNACIIFAGLASYALIPNPAILIAVFHLDEGSRHAWFKAAKELMYTVVPREVLYTVKPLIEMFFYRFARGLAGVLIYLFNTALGFGSMGVLAAGAVIAAAWFYCASLLSKEYTRIESSIQTRQVIESLELKDADSPINARDSASSQERLALTAK